MSWIATPQPARSVASTGPSVTFGRPVVAEGSARLRAFGSIDSFRNGRSRWNELPRAPRRPLPVSAKMPDHWRAFQRSPMPRPTASVPRRVDSPHRTHDPFRLREDGARAPPWRHARRSAGHKVTRLLRSQRQSPELRTDSCQTHPLSRHARATRSMAIRYAASRSETCSRSARSCTSQKALVIHESSLRSTSSRSQ